MNIYYLSNANLCVEKKGKRKGGKMVRETGIQK